MQISPTRTTTSKMMGSICLNKYLDVKLSFEGRNPPGPGGSLLLLRRGGEKTSKRDGNSITEKAFEDTQNRGGVYFF